MGWSGDRPNTSPLFQSSLDLPGNGTRMRRQRIRRMSPKADSRLNRDPSTQRINRPTEV